jgi:hypothetical protein
MKQRRSEGQVLIAYIGSLENYDEFPRVSIVLEEGRVLLGFGPIDPVFLNKPLGFPLTCLLLTSIRTDNDNEDYIQQHDDKDQDDS